MTTALFWRIFIGPALLPDDDPAHFDFSGYSFNGTDTLAFSSTLTAQLNSGATSLTLANASSFASKGGVWVAPGGGSGRAWEYIGYTGKSTNTLTGLIRESTTWREHNGVHGNGATVYQWYPLTQNDGRLHVVDDVLDAAMTTTGWYAEISGIAAPQVVFRQDHVAIVQYRTSPSGTWRHWLVGFLDSSSIQDDHRRVRGWTARIVSSVLLLNKFESRSVRVGEFDIAVHASATSSNPLPTISAHKERRSPADFVAAAPDFSADSAVDGDDSTLWIADEMVGTPNTPSGHNGISQFYINPPVTLNKGYRWIEIANVNIISDMVLRAYRDSDDAQSPDVPLPELNLTAESADTRYLIVCENEAKFLEANPSFRGVYLIDVEKEGIPSFFDYLDPAGGALALYWSSGPTYTDVVRWGTQVSAPSGWGSGHYVSGTIEPDDTVRIIYPSTWEISRNQSPGYTIKADGNDAWIAVELPGMGLRLRDAITDSSPDNGEPLYINDAQGPFTGGLPDSGTLQIGDERIAYSSKTDEAVILAGSGARGAGGTVAAAHSAGDPVYIVATQGGSSFTAATDALPIKTTAWYRYRGTIYPVDFHYWWSMLPARTPGESKDLYDNDYELNLPVTGHDESYQEVSHSPAARVKSFLLGFKKMSEDPARPRINTLKFIVDPSYYPSSYWLSGGESVEEVIEQILKNTKLPDNAVTVSSTGAVSSGHATEMGNTLTIISDLAEFGGCTIQAGFDSKITIAPDTFWGTAVGGHTASKTWSRSNAASVTREHRQATPYRQVQIEWRTADGSDSGTATYPETPYWKGALAQFGPMIYADEEAAELAARKRYWLARLPYDLVVECEEGDMTVRPRQVHAVQWQFHDDMQAVDRRMLVMSVDHLVEVVEGVPVLNTMVRGIQIDREMDG